MLCASIGFIQATRHDFATFRTWIQFFCRWLSRIQRKSRAGVASLFSLLSFLFLRPNLTKFRRKVQSESYIFAHIDKFLTLEVKHLAFTWSCCSFSLRFSRFFSLNFLSLLIRWHGNLSKHSIALNRACLWRRKLLKSLKCDFAIINHFSRSALMLFSSVPVSRYPTWR